MFWEWDNRSMSPIKRHLEGGADTEISTLIETSHQTERRLEQLTDGAVDAVTDRGGQTHLLRRAQDHLRYNDALKQAAILDALPANIALLDAQGNILSINQAWQRFAGANALQGGHCGVGINYLAICDSAQGNGAADARRAAAGIRSVFDGVESSFSMEYPCHFPTEQRWFMMTATPLGGVHPKCAVVMHLNITDRVCAEVELSRFRAAMDSAADAIFLVKRDSRRFVEVNVTACNMLGYSREELLQMDPTRLGARPCGQMGRGHDALIADHGRTELIETQMRRKDGSHLHVEVRRHTQYLGGDWIVIGVVSDITERKRASEALHESEQRIRAITANTPGMVFQCVLDTINGLFRFTYVSEGGRLVLGLAPEAILANWDAATALLAESDREAFHTSLHHSANAMETWNWEGRIALADGTEKWINGRATPRFSDEGDVIWEGVMLNITETKLGQQALIQSEQLLRELSAYSENTKEQERKRIAREVHDELGQALTVLRLDLGLLRLHFGAHNPQLVERIRQIKVDVDRTIKIMRNVTATLRPVALDLGLIAGIEWLVEEFNLCSGIDCSLLAGGCEDVRLDDGRSTALFRIVQESLNNVLKHAEASKVTVALELDGDDGIFLCIRDDGKGFDPESKGKAGSFGLVGMRERALMLRGTLDIESTPGGGTGVEVYIPLL